MSGGLLKTSQVKTTMAQASETTNNPAGNTNTATKQMVDKEAFKAAIFDAYGVTSFADLKKTPAWAAAYTRLAKDMAKGETPDNAAVLRALALVSNEINVPAWYIGHGTELKNENGGWLKKDVGPVVLLSTGDVKTIRGPTLVVKPLTPLGVGPVKQTKNLTFGTDTISVIKDKTKVIEQTHEFALPAVTLTRHIKRAMSLDTENAKKLDGKRGVVRGETGEEPVFGILNISSEPNDISFFTNNAKRGGGGELQFVARDADGNTVKIKVYDNPEKGIDTLSRVAALYGLSAEDSSSAEWRAVLPGEPIAVNGKIGLFHPVNLESLGEHQAAATNLLRQLHEANRLVEIGKAPDGQTLRGLDLKDMMTINPETNEPEQMVYVQAEGCPYKFYDIQMTWDKAANQGQGGVVYQFSVLATDKNAHSWMNVTEVAWGPNATGKTGINNKGAFILFLNRLSGAGKLKADDPFLDLMSAFEE